MNAGHSAIVKAEGWQFDLYQVEPWISSHRLLTALIVLVIYAFWISRRNGLVGLILEHRRANRELKAKVDLDREKLVLKYHTKNVADSKPRPSLPGPKPKRHHDRKTHGRRR